MTGRYPAGHGARHNGMRVDAAVPTLADDALGAGFATGAFVSAFPLDRRFGLNEGFDDYGDRMPRGAAAAPHNERPGRDTVDEALAWLTTTLTPSAANARSFCGSISSNRTRRMASRGSGRPVADRYDDEIAESDAQIGRILDGLGPAAASSVIVIAADHGEAFGEHGEISHSLFVYDTTLRVPLVMAGLGVPTRTVGSAVSLVDVAPTVLPLLGLARLDSDGVDLAPTFTGTELPGRDLYAESWAPLLDFGWSPLRSLRSGGFKYIEAPRAELYETARDPDEAHDLAAADAPRAAQLRDRLARYATAPTEAIPVDRDALARLQALGYASGSPRSSSGARPDPKDRREIAARLSQVVSGELQGPALEAALRRILSDDAKNPQANLRLGTCCSSRTGVGMQCRSSRRQLPRRFPAPIRISALRSARPRRGAWTKRRRRFEGRNASSPTIPSSSQTWESSCRTPGGSRTRLRHISAR